MFKRTTLICAALMAVTAQPPSPFFSYSSGGPSSSSFNSGGPPTSHFSSGGPPSFGSGGPSFSSSPFGSGGPPPSSPFNNGRPGSRPSGFPSSGHKGPKNSPGNKLFSWIGSTMSKLQGLGPKVHYYPPKSKPSSHGGPSLSSSPQNAPPSFHSSGPPRETISIPNSIFEGSNSSPFGGDSTVTFASPSHSNSIDHPRVAYRNPSGPPPSFGSRPGPPPPSFLSSRPPFGSRPPPSYSSGGPPPFSSSPYASSRPSFNGPPPSSFAPQHNRNNLEVFPSQQISYQSQTVSQNEPGYNDGFGSLQSLYASQSGNRPSYFPNQQGPSNFEQQSSYSQNQPQVSKNSGNYGATFHSIEPVRVAPIYDVGQQFKPSSTDMSGASSNVQHKQQQPSNIHDMPFATIVNEYAAHADAATAGSEQMFSAMQGGSDMATSASTNQPIPGVQFMGQGTSPDGNPVFEVVADANAPTYDGHPVDLNRLISMIEPGAQIDTIPNYGDADMSSSDQQPIYSQAPSNIELESDAAMASGIMSGNKTTASKKSQTRLNIVKVPFGNINDQLHAIASESRPTVVKLDGTRLNDEKLIKEHFDKEIILDDLQENKDHGFIIVGVPTDNDTGDQDQDEHLHGTNKNWTLIDNFDSNNNYENDNDDMLALVQKLRNSASSVLLDSFLKNNSETLTGTTSPNNSSTTNHERETNTMHHPNHNYYPELSPKVTIKEKNEHDSATNISLAVINPIFDSVRPISRVREMLDEESLKTSPISKSDIYQENTQVSEDNYSDDDELLSDDMITGTDGDLAAAGSRNVKSVAIIVTPPPNYVKIRNKYKKPITPLSALTSTTPLSNTSSVTPSPTPSSSGTVTFSESNITNNSESDQKIQIDQSPNSDTTTIAATMLRSSSNDSIFNASSIHTSEIGTTDPSNNKKTRRYPVYMRKANV